MKKSSLGKLLIVIGVIMILVGMGVFLWSIISLLHADASMSYELLGTAVVLFVAGVLLFGYGLHKINRENYYE